jgi:hypothetical protein
LNDRYALDKESLPHFELPFLEAVIQDITAVPHLLKSGS